MKDLETTEIVPTIYLCILSGEGTEWGQIGNDEDVTDYERMEALDGKFNICFRDFIKASESKMSLVMLIWGNSVKDGRKSAQSCGCKLKMLFVEGTRG
jgi:hypothetical protein